jgi:hypothetical protein
MEEGKEGEEGEEGDEGDEGGKEKHFPSSYLLSSFPPFPLSPFPPFKEITTQPRCHLRVSRGDFSSYDRFLPFFGRDLR